MNSSSPSRRTKTTALILVVSLLSVIGLTTPADSQASGGTPLLAVGDMADCGNNGGAPAQSVADLMGPRSGSILLLGDTAYPDGSATDFSNCFDPIFGTYKNRMLPAVGNHEYRTVNASNQPADYINYFGVSKTGPADKLYYETTVGDWQLLVLNTNDVNAAKTDCRFVGCTDGSAQFQWLEARLQAANAANPNQCRAIAMHHPRWSSYSSYPDQAWLGDIMDLAYQYGTDLVLTGHAHHYERFAPQTPGGAADSANGFQLMILGTGGVPHRSVGAAATNSAVRIDNAYGLTEFEFFPDHYTWNFVDTSGASLDSGSRDCVNKGTVVTTTSTTTTAPPTTTTAPFVPKPNERNAIGAEIYRLYLAVFERNPDNGGFTYWHDLRQTNTSLQFVADFFAASDEFVLTYGTLTDTQFIDQLYNNVLGRNADPGGRAYWLTQIANGAKRGDVIVWFSQSQEFVAAHPFG